MAISKFNVEVNNIQALDDNPNTSGMSASELKATFDKAGADIKTYLNNTLTEEVDTSISGLTNSVNNLNTSVNNMLNRVYPVGSIYLSFKNTNPSTLFGGTWTQLKNAFLFATNATSGDKGTGSGTGTNTGSTTLNANQIPSHSHGFGRNVPTSTGTFAGEDGGNISGSVQTYITTQTNKQISQITATQNTGGGQGHTHTIPYLEVYVWKRTS